MDVGTGFVDILPRSDKFAGLLASQLKGVNAGLLGLGAAAAVGIGASVKLASDFEDSMNRIQGLVGLSAGAVAGLSDQVLGLAKTVPVGPVELADALFFITSAGLRGKDAMDALTASAQASAAGLGDTATVADAVTSAVNSYAQSGLTAAAATDIMIAAVREGKLPPEELAGVLGQVLPVASQMGVQFDEVAAAIASMTRQGLSAGRAATGIRFLLTSFTKPSSEAADALDSVGLTLGQLQSELASQGLLATLQDLAARFDLNTAKGKQMFATVVGGARGMSAASILVGENGAAIDKVFEHVQDSAGSTAQALEVASQKMSFQWQQFTTDLQVVGIQIGSELLPPLTQALHALVGLVGPIGTILGLAAKLTPAIIGLGAAFLTMKAVNLVANLLVSFGVALEGLGLKTAVSGVVSLAAAIQALAAPIAVVIGAGFAAWLVYTTLHAKDAAHNLEVMGEQIKAISEVQAASVASGDDFLTNVTSFGVVFGTAADAAARFGQTNELIQGTLSKLQTEFVRGEISRKLFIADMKVMAGYTGQNINVNKAMNQSLDRMRVHFTDTGKTVRNFANLTGGDLRDWRAGVNDDITGAITDLSNLESVFQQTPAELRKAFHRMLVDATKWHHDMDVLLALKPGTLGLSQQDMDLFEHDLLQNKEATNAFVASTHAGRLQMVQDWLATRGQLHAASVDLSKLTGAMNKVPKDVSTKFHIFTEGEEKLFQVASTLSGLKSEYHFTLSETIQKTTRTVPTPAKGAIIHGASGFVTRGVTAIVGEGTNQTPFGRGTEAVLPFDRGGQAILDQAMVAALRRVLGNAPAAQSQQPMRVVGEMRMRDWKQGLVDLDGELDWERLARTS